MYSNATYHLMFTIVYKQFQQISVGIGYPDLKRGLVCFPRKLIPYPH